MSSWCTTTEQQLMLGRNNKSHASNQTLPKSLITTAICVQRINTGMHQPASTADCHKLEHHTSTNIILQDLSNVFFINHLFLQWASVCFSWRSWSICQCLFHKPYIFNHLPFLQWASVCFSWSQLLVGAAAAVPPLSPLSSSICQVTAGGQPCAVYRRPPQGNGPSSLPWQVCQ